MKKLGVMLGGRTGGMIAGALEIIIGVLLLIDPVGFTTGIVVAIGAILTVAGLVNVIRYFRSPAQMYGDWMLGRGLLMVLGGLFCMVNSGWILAVLPALFTVYGIIMLVAGVMKLQHVVDLKRMGHPKWYAAGIAARAYVLIAVIIPMNPFGATVMVWQFIGISMIVSAALDMASLIIAG